MVYYTALKLLKNENEAQDLVQDTYLRAMEHLDSLREAEAFPGWIKRICVNLCKNHLTAKRPLLLGDDKQDFLMSLEPEVQEDFLPHAYADKMETCRLIDRMVDALPAASAIRSALELGAAGGAVAVGTAAAVEAVEALGGPEQLLGKSVDEITAYLGEPTYNDGYGQIEYFCGEERRILSLYLVETGECMGAAMASEWFDSLGLDDAAPQEVETILISGRQLARGNSLRGERLPPAC